MDSIFWLRPRIERAGCCSAGPVPPPLEVIGVVYCVYMWHHEDGVSVGLAWGNGAGKPVPNQEVALG
jgi:hypothetical protein